MCRAEKRWTKALPLFLGMHTAFKEDLQASVAELVYGEPLRIPGELVAASSNTGDPSELIIQLRRHFEQLRPVPAARHASPAVFIHKDLADSTRLPPAGCSTAPRGSPLQRPLEGPGPHKEYDEWPTWHGVNRQGEASLHHVGDRQPHRDRSGTPGADNATRTKIEHTDPTSHADHPFWPPRPPPSAVQRVSTLLRGGDVGTPHKSAAPVRTPAQLPHEPIRGPFLGPVQHLHETSGPFQVPSRYSDQSHKCFDQPQDNLF